MATINEFKALDLRVGKIVEVDELEGARKPIYKLRIDLGELGMRNIAAGIKGLYTKEELTGRLVIVIANLEPRNIANFMSEGMVLAAEDGSSIALLKPDKELAPGSRIT